MTIFSPLNLKVDHLKGFISFVLVIVTCLQTQAQPRNWSEFMDRQAMKWDSIGGDYYSGAFLGNGLIGINVYQPEPNIVHFDIGRTDVTDNRADEYPDGDVAYTKSRLPIGYFTLKPKGTIQSSNLKLDIYNAKLSGKLVTSQGEITIDAYVSATLETIVINLSGTGKESTPSLDFIPAQSISPRALRNPSGKPEGYEPNAPVRYLREGHYHIYHQPLSDKCGYATVFKKNGDQTLVSIGNDRSGDHDEVGEAKENIIALEQDKDNYRKHQEWWHNFYQKMFISLPDKRLETFYWAQLYKFASASRKGKPMVDLMGPWMSSTPWPAVWWNLNTQLSYSPLFTSNHLELTRPLFETLHKYRNNLRLNAPKAWQSQDVMTIETVTSYDLLRKVTDEDLASGKFEIGNLAWVLFHYYQYYLYTGDKKELKDRIFPMLKSCANYMILTLNKDGAGTYHMRLSRSPEYKKYAEDANYGLSSLRWALNTLIKINNTLQINDKDESKWKEVLENLVDYPQDGTGFMIGKDVPLASSHRHYSHLMMIYPYRLLHWENEEDRSIMERSVEHWISLKGALAGYSWTGASSMYSGMEKGNEAYEMLNSLLDKHGEANTLYRESGPVFETPLSAVTSINEMLIQSWGGKIRVFPAIPDSWKSIAFDKLLAEGAFEVSAKYVNGKTTFIKVKSKIGGTCTLQTTLKPALLTDEKGRTVNFDLKSKEGKNLITFDTKAGDIITLTEDKNTDPHIGPVAGEHFASWHWGVNKK